MRTQTTKIANATLSAALVIVICLTIATEVVLKQIRIEETQEAAEVQDHALKLFWELYLARGTNWSVQGRDLMVGSYRVSGSQAVPDRVKAITGSTASVFLDGTRVATNAFYPTGRRAQVTRMPADIYTSVVGRGKPYRGESLVLGEKFLCAYDPIRDRHGNVIGALAVGARAGDYLVPYRRTALRIRAINTVLTCIFILCAFLLLTERRRAQERIEKQLDFLQVIIDAIPAPVFYKDAAGIYLGFNKIYEEYIGLSREQMLGRSVFELWAPDAAEIFHKMDQQLFAAPGVQTYETSAVRHSDGTHHSVIMNKATFHNPDGSLGGLVGVMLDITERKAAEEETRNAYRKLADILEFLPDPTFVVDQERRVIAWNLAIEELSGVGKEQILGNGNYAYAVPFYGVRRKMLIDLLEDPPETQESWYAGITRSGETLSAEAWLGLHNGERYLWSAASPLYDLQGNQVGGIQTVRDLTDVRLAEQERHRLEMQLKHSNMIESLLTQLSHDLRTPLTPLFALLPMVRRHVKDPKLERMVALCEESVQQIQGLTVKALDLVRLSGAQQPVQLSPVPLAGIARVSLHGCAASFEQRGVTCLNEIDPQLSVFGQPEQLALLFDNLLSNAARYAADCGYVRIQANRTEETVTVAVHDDGLGLEPGHCELIFREFYKVDAARHDTKTQGLGLPICKTIVMNHQGRIWAESPGLSRGTTIFFTLKAVEA
ncbi:hypothetical protein GMLC_32140 [Geomonas limicola]|uniref:histidine kinase n=1 Tax=Geomonas limicola TaxID=2740186 RepID=A0A6V8NAI7_9BACT|nr:PAS domain S-box protein [Geomonas limicola]GFO69635.1 hypothetical protein GMLC_32140 [Geomonas limicola]